MKFRDKCHLFLNGSSCNFSPDQDYLKAVIAAKTLYIKIDFVAEISTIKYLHVISCSIVDFLKKTITSAWFAGKFSPVVVNILITDCKRLQTFA